jgi:hypothetical protein
MYAGLSPTPGRKKSFREKDKQKKSRVEELSNNLILPVWYADATTSSVLGVIWAISAGNECASSTRLLHRQGGCLVFAPALFRYN